MADATSFRNQLLAKLPPDDLAKLSRHMRMVELRPGMILEGANTRIDSVFFPESGIASVVATADGGRKMEAGPFGRDGMSGLAILHQSDTTPSETVVQIEGIASMVPADAFASVMGESPAARRLFLRYSYAFSLQSIHTAVAASVAVIEQRLARWLLMLSDRVDGDTLRLTHAFMAMMLAVRRPGVTTALHVLEGQGLIRSTRNLVTIRDRDGLVRLCGSIYGVPEAEYRRLVLNA